MKSFTSRAPVDEILNLVFRSVSDILGDQFVGMYLHGSLALNDFVPERSDIDLVVVTKTNLPGDLLKKLKEMHAKNTSSSAPYSQRMECIYVPVASLANYVEEKAYFPCFRVGGEFHLDGFGILQKHVLRERGITLKGPDPKTFIQVVTPAKLRMASFDALKNWWLPQLRNHSRLIKDDYQVYAVLTMCRALYTIQNGDIVSKSEAASRAKKVVGQKYSTLIDKALTWKNGEKFNKLEETLDFMRYTLTQVGVAK